MPAPDGRLRLGAGNASDGYGFWPEAAMEIFGMPRRGRVFQGDGSIHFLFWPLIAAGRRAGTSFRPAGQQRSTGDSQGGRREDSTRNFRIPRRGADLLFAALRDPEEARSSPAA